MVIRILNSSLIFDRRVVTAIAGAAILLFTFTFLYSPDLRPSADWIPPLTSKPPPYFSAPPKNAQDPNIIELDYLRIKPNVTDKVRTYWNIPYAASAAGKNRFRGPQPLNRTYGVGRGEKPLVWSGELGMCPGIQKIDANSRNKNDIAGEDVLGINTRSTEDCLSLNVFTPIDAEAGDDLPVLVNIPGGGFHLPGRSNGGEMVEKSRREKGVNGKLDKGIVVVTMYYRNGIYGFLSGKEIAKDGDYNNALRDQRATLEWIQKYIRYFGGNPDHVVLMGTSAGGASVLLQLTANEGDNHAPIPGTGRKPLFHGAIAQSPASPTFFTPAQAEKFWNEVADGLNCTDIACVRDASPGDLYYENYPMNFPDRNTPPRWMWAPTTEPEGGMWTEPAPAAIMNGRYAKVPTIIGFTSNEGTDQVKKTTDTLQEFKDYLQNHYPLLTNDDLNLLAKTYPNDRHWPDSGQFWDAVAKAQGDIRYICPTYLASTAMATHNPANVPTYQYQWDVMWGVDIENGFGTKHAGTVGQVMVRRQNEISDYFISFVKFLDPNVERTKGIAKWDALDESGRRLFFTNLKEGAKRGDGTNMLGPMRVDMRARDQARARSCEVVRGLMGRLQMERGEAVRLD
ncbi:lipase 1 precursor [Dothidotthia symphoricarpi CBS 119687]|uniref:Carboxylic ester hydrolase n=1 Tax=Dothidotthia symphoricarpi CBS 119687 TaxID=1392245 RepID=A0A6A6AGF8_9PLEO|nr:lipase 1 precursor [Dothidotthia symphoricarpi CBS 119687]KAF2130343.1 lipase 1 precursor [Dothidotthia symphoricarpi CBS 119687]